METLKQYYNEVFQKRFPADEHPEFEKLDPAMIKAIENSFNFSAYKLDIAFKQLAKATSISAEQLKKSALKLHKAFRKLPTKHKPRY